MSKAWAPPAALTSVYDDVADAGASNKAQGSGAEGTRGFVPASTWLGRRPGFYFGTRDQGTGYYQDPRQAVAQAVTVNGTPGSGADAAASSSAREDAAAAPATAAAPDGEELLREAEAQLDVGEIQQLDARGVKRLVVAFERKYKENMEARMKYSDQPDKFLDSEVDLDEHVKSLMQVAGYPDLYPVLLEQPGCVPSLLALLSHENTDIAADAIELLSELTGADAVSGYEAEGQALVEALLENNAPELMVQRLTTLNEAVDDEATAVNNLLQVVENMVEVKLEVAEELVARTGLLQWLLMRVRKKAFDSNKQYASEVLAILLQGNPILQRKLLSVDGIDVLLQAVAPFKGKDPATAEEEEFMQNCFDILCTCVMLPECKAAFLKAEGVELMYLMLQGRRLSRFGAVRLLDFVTSRNTAACEKLVDLGGLRSLFGLFMGKAKAKGPKGERDVEAEVEERTVSIIGNLMTGLGKGSRRDRVSAKFVESEFEKCDRLFEVYYRYATKVAAEERRIADSLVAEREAAGDDDETAGRISEEELLVARLGAGLFTLQQAALILGHLWATTDPGLRRRILKLLHQQSQSLSDIRDHLLEFYETIGTEGGVEEQERQRTKLRTVLEAMGASLKVGAADPPPPPLPPPAPPLPPSTEGDGIKVQPKGVDAMLPPLPAKVTSSKADKAAKIERAAAAFRKERGEGDVGGEDGLRQGYDGAGSGRGRDEPRVRGERARGGDDEHRAAAPQQPPSSLADRDRRGSDRDVSTKDGGLERSRKASDGRSSRDYADDEDVRGGGTGRVESPPPPVKSAYHGERDDRDRNTHRHRDRSERSKDHDGDKERGRDKDRERDRDHARGDKERGGRDAEKERSGRDRHDSKRDREGKNESREEREERRARKRERRSLSR